MIAHVPPWFRKPRSFACPGGAGTTQSCFGLLILPLGPMTAGAFLLRESLTFGEVVLSEPKGKISGRQGESSSLVSFCLP